MNGKRRYLARAIVLLLLACALSSLRAAAQSTNGGASRALIISLDGLDTRYLQRRDALGLKIPHLRGLIGRGILADGVESVYPSVTYPNHTSMATGVRPSKHGIFGNTLFEDPTASPTGGANWYPRLIKVETLWDAARKAGLKVGFVWWPVSVGAGDYNVPEIWKPGGTLLENREIVAANARPADLVREAERAMPDLYDLVTKDEGDDARTRLAEYILREKRPELMFVHLFDLDHAQHDFGPFTTQALAELERTDAYVGRLLEALRSNNTFGQTSVFIVSDHGFLPITKQFNPGALLVQAGLIKLETVKGKPAAVKEWKALPYITGGSCALMLRDANDRATLKKLRQIFAPHVSPRAGLRRIIERRELEKLGSNTNAALMLEAADGFVFGARYTGGAIGETKSRGTHGYLPQHADYRASFIAAGAGVARRGRVDQLSMIDIGPTVARALGLTLPQADGRAVDLK